MAAAGRWRFRLKRSGAGRAGRGSLSYCMVPLDSSPAGRAARKCGGSEWARTRASGQPAHSAARCRSPPPQATSPPWRSGAAPPSGQCVTLDAAGARRTPRGAPRHARRLRQQRCATPAPRAQPRPRSAVRLLEARARAVAAEPARARGARRPAVSAGRGAPLLPTRASTSDAPLPQTRAARRTSWARSGGGPPPAACGRTAGARPSPGGERGGQG